MHLGGKYQISWSNDALESFLQIRPLCAPHESITSQGAMADRVNLGNYLLKRCSNKNDSFENVISRRPNLRDLMALTSSY